MFKSLKAVTYYVPDLEQAKRWYAQILNAQPVLDTPQIVYFLIGDCPLALVPNPAQSAPGSATSVVYWWVDDIAAAVQQLQDCGATVQSEIKHNPVLRSSAAVVTDPAGNRLGLMGTTPESARPSLDNQPSASAFNVARCRAIAAHDPREEIRGADTLAEVFLGEEAQKSLQNPAMHAVILKKLDAFSPGAYEYFIARTAYLDAIVEQALRENMPQIVFLGAGYDTRAYRYRHLIQDTRIFELDSRVTQEHKRSLLEQAHLAPPEALTYLPINFTKDDLGAILAGAGYSPDRQTLFIWEGVTYYLPPQAVDAMLRFVREHAPAGSALCFDYMITESDMANRFGAKQARDAMQATYDAEPLQFDLEERRVETFLAERGFHTVEHLNTDAMRARYLTLRDGSPAGNMLDLFGFVRATLG